MRYQNLFFTGLVSAALIMPVYSSLKTKTCIYHPKKKHTFYPGYGWKDPKRTLSGSPTLTGKQMGVIETLGIPPLGYTKKGNIKIFHLVAQPVEQWIVSGTPTHKKLVPTLRSLFGMHSMHLKQKVRLWGYNGSSPGPTIELTEGDTVRIILKN